MEPTAAHLERIKDRLPVERGNVRTGVLGFLNAVLHAAEIACKWRRLPSSFGRWPTIHARLDRRSKKGVWARVFTRLQEEGLLQVELRVVALDGTIARVHPDGTGAVKKRAASHRKFTRRQRL